MCRCVSIGWCVCVWMAGLYVVWEGLIKLDMADFWCSVACVYEMYVVCMCVCVYVCVCVTVCVCVCVCVCECMCECMCV